MKNIVVGTIALLLLLGARPASATFSIVACDSNRNCGAAVATNNLAVGATVIYAKALAAFAGTNPVWAKREMGVPLYAPLWRESSAAQWRERNYP